MNQNYNTPIFICELDSYDDFADTTVIRAFLAEYPRFKEALKFAMYGGRCILKFLKDGNPVYVYNAIVIKESGINLNATEAGFITLTLRYEIDEQVSESDAVIQYGGAT